MIQLVTHDYCHNCPLFEARSLSSVDYEVDGYKRHYVSCIHHTVCATIESHIRESIVKKEKEKENG